MPNLYLLIKQFLSEIKPSYSGSHSRDIFQTVIKEYRKANWSQKEITVFKAIETRRQQLLQSKETILKTDYGAGSNILESKEAEIVKDICRTSSKKQSTCLFLYQLVKNFQPRHAIELGTCFGISGAYQASALPPNDKMVFLTIEGSPGRAAIALETFKSLSLNNIVNLEQGRFENVLDKQFAELGFVDYIFIDGHHQESATINYFNKALPFFTKGGIMIFDDIYWSQGMYRAWKIINKSGAFKATCAYRGMGIGII